MTRSAIFSVMFLAMVLVGCEGARFPLSSPDVAVADTTLNGYWEMISDDDEPADVLIATFDDHQYYVEMETEDDVPQRMRAFTSEFAGLTFVNLSCVACTDDEQDWLFMGMERVGEDLVLHPLLDSHYKNALAELSDQGAVRDYVRHHAEAGTLFDKPLRLIRR